MNKELVISVLIAFMVLYASPQIGMLSSIVGVLIIMALPIAVLVVFLTPALRSRFLSA